MFELADMRSQIDFRLRTSEATSGVTAARVVDAVEDAAVLQALDCWESVQPGV